MKLKHRFSITTVMDEIIAVPVDSDSQFNGVLAINETMKDIMELLSEDITEEALVREMMEMYKDVTWEEMETAIHEVCCNLRNEGILT